MKLKEISKTGNWRARQTIINAAEDIRMNGSCMVTAASEKNWPEVHQLWLETKWEIAKLDAIFES